MELRHLRYFIAVAEELSFSKAAMRMRIAQPPLSQQIKSLEEEIGLRLFERTNRSVALTQAGREFLVDARLVLGSVARLEGNARLRSQGGAGLVAIGVITSAVAPSFAAMLREFQKRHTGIKISLTDHSSSWQLEALASGKIDVGFLRPQKKMPLALDIHRVKKVSLSLAVPTGHKLSKKKRVEWSDLAREELILVQPEVAPDYYTELYARCRKAGFEPRVQQFTTNVATQLWLVSAGLGVAPMSITAEVTRQTGVTLVPLPEDAPVYETIMAWRKGDSSPALSRFVQFFRSREGA